MPKISWSIDVQQRVRRLLEELLSYVLDYRNDLQLQYRWEDEDTNRPKLIVETQRRFLEALAQFEKQHDFYEAINRLKDLNIYEDRRFHTRGKDYWHFALTLWGKDKQKNIKEFDRKWECRKPEKSKKMDEKKKPTLEKSDVSKHHSQPMFEIQDNSYQRSFVIGTHIDTNKIISLDFARLLESSVGVFGNPGTGKTFLTRLLLSGLISQQAAVNLIFDLHSEYGWEAVSRGQPSIVKGLWHLFPKSVEIYTLDSESTRRQGIHAHELYLSYDQIDVEDIKLVSQDLGLSEDSIDNAYILCCEFGKHWIVQLLNMTNEEIQIFCKEKRGQKDLIMALQHKLQRLDGLKNMRASLPQNYIHQLLQSLADGKNVVVMFGSEFDMLSYKLITNMIARRIYLHYVRKTEKFLQTKNPKDRPCQLVITIEDAHHLLNSNTVRHNIFNNIIRQSWKSCITLLAVERYPSRIDKEVMSELGTRITGLLNDEDIDAISTGIPSYHCLRSMLSKLDSTQQAVIFGHVVTAPVAVRTRPYDEQFYDEIRDVAR